MGKNKNRSSNSSKQQPKSAVATPVVERQEDVFSVSGSAADGKVSLGEIQEYLETCTYEQVKSLELLPNQPAELEAASKAFLGILLGRINKNVSTSALFGEPETEVREKVVKTILNGIDSLPPAKTVGFALQGKLYVEEEEPETPATTAPTTPGTTATSVKEVTSPAPAKKSIFQEITKTALNGAYLKFLERVETTEDLIKIMSEDLALSREAFMGGLREVIDIFKNKFGTTKVEVPAGPIKGAEDFMANIEDIFAGYGVTESAQMEILERLAPKGTSEVKEEQNYPEKDVEVPMSLAQYTFLMRLITIEAEQAENADQAAAETTAK